jgi:hypothetical protein
MRSAAPESPRRRLQAQAANTVSLTVDTRPSDVRDLGFQDRRLPDAFSHLDLDFRLCRFHRRTMGNRTVYSLSDKRWTGAPVYLTSSTAISATMNVSDPVKTNRPSIPVVFSYVDPKPRL